jgi:electron transport complex protein RnfE
MPIEPAANPQVATASQDFTNGLWTQNPVFVQVLGMCPVMAVSNSAINALAMGLATATVLVMSNTVVSLIKNQVPEQARIVTFILIIATFVTIVDYLVQAISLELHGALGAFLSLIVVNCLILGRAEAFASKQSLRRSIVDALGMGAGFVVSLLCLGIVREVLGQGSIFGQDLFGQSFQVWTVMLLPPGGFFVLAAWVMLFHACKNRNRQLIAPPNSKNDTYQQAST